MNRVLLIPDASKSDPRKKKRNRKGTLAEGTDGSVRTWTDERDGRTWTIRAFWSRDALMMAQLVFECARESYETWWVSRRNLPGLRSVELEHLLDEARGSTT